MIYKQGILFMQRGQTVLEFLFIVLIIIIYLTTLVIPMSKDAQNAISDTEKLSRANNETQKIVNAIEKVSLLGIDSRETVDVFVPEDTQIKCDNTSGLSFEVTLKLQPYPEITGNTTTTGCNSATGKCTKTFAKPANVTTLTCNLSSLPQYSKVSVTAEKTGAGTITLTEAS